MDANMVDLLKALAPVGGTVVAAILGLLGGLFIERRRHDWGRQTQPTEAKMVAYARAVKLLNRLEPPFPGTSPDDEIGFNRDQQRAGAELKSVAFDLRLLAPISVTDALFWMGTIGVHGLRRPAGGAILITPDDELRWSPSETASMYVRRGIDVAIDRMREDLKT